MLINGKLTLTFRYQSILIIS